jgi:protein phosphatase
VRGRRLLLPTCWKTHSRLQSNITIKSRNAIAALEVMRAIYANPQMARITYFHPQCSRCYRKTTGTFVNIDRHLPQTNLRWMIVYHDEFTKQTARLAFSITASPVCYTRTGRHFFNNHDLETEF